MTSRYIAIVLALACLCQVYEAARLVPRSADDRSDGNIASSAGDAFKKAEEAIGNTFSSVRDGVQDLLKRAPSLDDLVSGVQQGAKKFSSGVEDLTRRVSGSIKSDSHTPSPP